MSEAGKDALRVGCTSWTFVCDRTIMFAFHGARVSSDPRDVCGPPALKPADRSR